MHCCIDGLGFNRARANECYYLAGSTPESLIAGCSLRLALRSTSLHFVSCFLDLRMLEATRDTRGHATLEARGMTEPPRNGQSNHHKELTGSPDFGWAGVGADEDRRHQRRVLKGGTGFTDRGYRMEEG